jgi:hypothetical protein
LKTGRSKTVLTQRAWKLALLLVAGCGSPSSDPCASVSGACLGLTVTSSSITSVDTLQITAFGATKASAAGKPSPLPIRVAIMPPASLTSDAITLTVEGYLNGALVGKGSSTGTLDGGRASIEVVLVSSGTGGDGGGMVVECGGATPDSCGTQCVNLQTSLSNCGTCGNLCTFPHAAATCNGTCAMGACAQDYGDCKNGTSDGCETLVKGSDGNNCGGCGLACKLGQVCSSGTCIENTVTCASPGIACDAAHGPACYTTGKFSVTADVVVDLTNGRRIWQRNYQGPATYGTAKSYCMGLSLANLTGWRLPSYAELATLLYMQGGLQGCPACQPAIDQAAFPNALGGGDELYWTTDYDASLPGYKAVAFCDGRSNYTNLSTQPTKFRCVHDPLP